MSNSAKNIQPDNSCKSSALPNNDRKAPAFVYRGGPVYILLDPILLGGLLTCAEFVPDFVSENEELFCHAFARTFYGRILSVSANCRSKALERKSPYCDYDPDELAQYILGNAAGETLSIATETFRKVLGWYNANGSAAHTSITADARAAADKLIERSADILSDLNKRLSVFSDCDAVARLRTVKCLKDAVAAAAREASLHLSAILPQMIFNFHYERRHGNVVAGALSADINAAAGSALLTPERRADVELRLYYLGLENGKALSSAAFSDNSLIISAFYRGKLDPIRAIVSMACRVCTASAGGSIKADAYPVHRSLGRYQDIDGFFRMLSASGRTVRELFDYAVSGSMLYFGIYTPRADCDRILAKLTKAGIADENVLDVIRRLIADEVRKKDERASNDVSCKTGLYRGRPFDSDEAVKEYIQLSNSKTNDKLGGKDEKKK